MFYHSTKPILRKQFSITFSSKMDENEHLVVRVFNMLRSASRLVQACRSISVSRATYHLLVLVALMTEL
jgi:hypothetical protein